MKEISYSFIHSDFKINGISADKKTLLDFAFSCSKAEETHLKSVGNFLIDWLDNHDFISVQTSGSTGIPKKILLKKQYMVNSALATGEFLRLKPKNKALLCLPADFIAGKMMLVRAIVLGLELEIVAPSSTPLAQTATNYDFAAMIPLQASKSLFDLHRIKKIILGGAAINTDLEQKLHEIPTEIYASYGMTETISHIAMRNIHHSKANFYTALPNVSFSVDNRNCLIINALRVSEVPIITNDVVELHSPTEFSWVGRFDNIINSGGIKIFPEKVEQKMKKYISDEFFVIGEIDEILGQKMVLYIEGNQTNYPKLLDKFLADDDFSKYEIPKQIYFLPLFEYTENQKVKRQETIKKHKK